MINFGLLQHDKWLQRQLQDLQKINWHKKAMSYDIQLLLMGFLFDGSVSVTCTYTNDRFNSVLIGQS